MRFVVDDGRSWFARTQEKFDLIEMSMVDTWAATGAGAFSLSENGLYTVEGWKTFLSALKPNGLFTVSRWHSPRSTVELGRVVSLAVAALMELGVERPSDHIFIAGIGNLATAIVSRAPFARSDLQVLQEAADKLRFTVLASPDRPATDPVILDMLTAQNLQDLNARAARHFLDVSPPTDAGRSSSISFGLPTRATSTSPCANGARARRSIRDRAGAATSSPSARFSWSFSCRPSWSYTSSSCRRDPPFARSTGNWRWSAAAIFC